MPITHELIRTCPVERTPRVLQLEGLFDIPPTQRSEQRWTVNLPLDEKPWNIGLIVGPSGCGKTTLARELFAGSLVHGYDWPASKSLVDGFPAGMSIKDIVALLSAVGFSSPPSWLRPFGVLSNGEQFRATIARALAEDKPLTVLDEFTSVVDRTVAKIGSAAVAKTVRRLKRQLIAVSCHMDIIDWLTPDWIYEPALNSFQWRLLQPRPAITLTIRRAGKGAWDLFKKHHYLNTSLSSSARCFVAFFQGRPCAFASVISQAGKARAFREHRTVCLPDFQGVGIGNALSEFVAALFAGVGCKYYSVTGNLAMMRHRARSPLWKMHRPPMRSGVNRGVFQTDGDAVVSRLNSAQANRRLVAGFTYVGAGRAEDAKALGITAPKTRSSHQRSARRSSGTSKKES